MSALPLCWFLSGVQRVGLPRDLHWLFPRPDFNNSPRACTIPNTAMECCCFLFSFSSFSSPSLCYWLSAFLTWIPEYIPSYPSRPSWCFESYLPTEYNCKPVKLYCDGNAWIHILTHLLCMKYVQKLHIEPSGRRDVDNLKRFNTVGLTEPDGEMWDFYSYSLQG